MNNSVDVLDDDATPSGSEEEEGGGEEEVAAPLAGRPHEAERRAPLGAPLGAAREAAREAALVPAAREIEGGAMREAVQAAQADVLVDAVDAEAAGGHPDAPGLRRRVPRH